MTEMYSHTVPEARSPKSRSQQGCAPSKARETVPRALPLALGAAGILGMPCFWRGPSGVCFCLRTAFTSLSVCFLFL